MARVATRRALFMRSAAVAATSWWLTGGIAAANCIAAYCPKGAADLASSYVNLANPGTYNAAPGTAPSFDTATGWDFLAASSQYLTTGYTLTDTTTRSAFIRFSDRVTNGYLFGAYSSVGSSYAFGMQGNNGSAKRGYANGNQVVVTPNVASGVLGFAGADAYYNGADDGDLTGAYTFAAMPVYIGARYLSGGPNTYQTVKIQALAIYNVTLDAPTVALLSAAMAAL